MNDSSDNATAETAAVERAREAALRILERRRRTRQELDDRLRQAGHDAESRRLALERLARVGLVDDLEYARAFLREKLPRRAVGDRVLQVDLQRRGVAAELVRQALDELSGEMESSGGTTERERARKALAQLHPRYAKLDPVVARRRLCAAMARRGFSQRVVESLLANAAEEPAEEPALPPRFGRFE